MTPAPPRPDALAVRPAVSRAVLPADAAARLFGGPLRGTERAAVVRLGRVLAHVAVEAGPALRLTLDGLDAGAVLGLEGEPRVDGVRLQGPVGVVDAPAPEAVRSRLVLPDGTRRAWGVPDRAVLAFGPLALAVPVEGGADAHAALDRALWLGAGRPATARWRPGLDLAPPAPPAADVRDYAVERGVVTETDVRQARLRRQTIRVRPGQVVTPSARSLGREWDVLRE